MPTAKAAMPFSYPYDHTDPASTGCSLHTQTPYNVSDSAIEIQLRYSTTCYTAWARSITNQYIKYTLSAQRSNDGAHEDFSYDLGGAYTYQLYDAGSLHTRAYVSYYWVLTPWSTGSLATYYW